MVLTPWLFYDNDNVIGEPYLRSLVQVQLYSPNPTENPVPSCLTSLGNIQNLSMEIGVLEYARLFNPYGMGKTQGESGEGQKGCES